MTGHWAVGQCAHCGAPLDYESPALFCSQRCKNTAKDVRYFRRCYREARVLDPDVRAALGKRMAFHVAGGYDANSRRLDRDVRQAILVDHDGRCRICGEAPATQVDHIDGSSNARGNLQGVCVPCHDAKTNERMVPMSEGDKKVRDVFLELVHAAEPVMAAHDELSWPTTWRSKLAQTREWAELVSDDVDAGYFGDGSTGTVDDHEHGIYLRMLAERDD